VRCGTKFVTLSHNGLPHAALRKFVAQFGSEVTTMAKTEQTKLESGSAVIEQTLRTLTELIHGDGDLYEEPPAQKCHPKSMD
jgi:hypothetical protein